MNSHCAAVIQMTSSQHLTTNLKYARIFLEQAADAGAKLAVLPEMWATMMMQAADKIHAAEKLGHGPIQEFLQQAAIDLKLWIVGGTIPLKSDHCEKIRAACLVLNDQGQIVARYDKIHLFDATITKHHEQYQESDTTEPGTMLVAIDTPIGRLGLAVCYDIRFPELFRALAMQEVEIFAIPAAFTVPTGQAHWQLLTRARAVENFCYVLGACQWGTHDTGRKTFGGSCIIEPWGEVIQSLEQGTGVLTAPIDLTHLYEIRERMPVLQHRRLP